MTVPETAARARLGNGARAERLVPHPSLPLVAVQDSGRPAVHVWSHGDGALREAGIVGGDSPAYEDSAGWQRIKRTPGVAWHPGKALLLIAGEDGVTQWTASGAFLLDGLPDVAGQPG